MRLLAVCERLRRLPESRWQRPPVAPLGARAPGDAHEVSGPTLEALVRDAIVRLMDADARARGVRPIAVEVGAFALPDVVAALARSITAGGDPAALAVLEDVTRESRDWA